MPEYLRVMIWCYRAGFCHFGQAKSDTIRKDGGEEQAGIGTGNVIFYMRKMSGKYRPAVYLIENFRDFRAR